jgi:hypothetical protein
MPGLAINTATARTGLEVGLLTNYNTQVPELAINAMTTCTGFKVGLLTNYNNQRCQG